MEPPLPLGAQMEGGDPEVAPLHVVPLVLQISPLPGFSDQEEYFYNASLDNHHGSFAATCVFFSAQGHTVVAHECQGIGAFQAARSFGLALHPIANLPPCVFTKGYATLQVLVLATTAVPAVPAAGTATDAGGVFLSSLIDCYADISLVLLLARSFPEVGPLGPPFHAGASYGSSHPSHWPDTNGLDVATSLPSSIQVGHSQHGGYSSYPYGYGHRYDPVSPLCLCHGGGLSLWRHTLTLLRFSIFMGGSLQAL